MRKRRKRKISPKPGKKVFYPAHRKSRKGFEQYRDLFRGVQEGGLIDVFYIFKVGASWWACRKGEHWGSLGFYHEGEYYQKIVKVDTFTRPPGTRVLGHIKKNRVLHMSIFMHKFVFIKDVFQPGFGLQEVCKKKDFEFIIYPYYVFENNRLRRREGF